FPNATQALTLPGLLATSARRWVSDDCPHAGESRTSAARTTSAARLLHLRLPRTIPASRSLRETPSQKLRVRRLGQRVPRETRRQVYNGPHRSACEKPCPPAPLRAARNAWWREERLRPRGRRRALARARRPAAPAARRRRRRRGRG